MYSESLQENAEQKNAPLISVRTHFAVSTNSQAEKAIPVSLRTVPSVIWKQMASEAEQIVLPHRPGALAITLKRKQIQKPLHLLKLQKRINTKTQEISHIIRECTVIRTSYEHQDLCDFISSEGSELLPPKDPYNLDKNDLLTLVKHQFQDRNEARNQNTKIEHNEKLWKLIKPTNFLKSFNLAPPKCDFFVNKVKHEDQRQLGSYSIGFEDKLPEPSKEIPENIKENELFKVISGYLEKRPCWLKNVILVTLKQQGLWGKFGFNELKNVLRYLCYTFRNGPWKHTFCAFGFDPRKNFKTVIYQSVSLKLKKKEAEDYEDEVEEELYDPSFTDISAKYIRAYQLSDIALESVQQILRGKLISGELECSKEHGWLTPTEHSQILKILRIHKQTLESSVQ